MSSWQAQPGGSSPGDLKGWSEDKTGQFWRAQVSQLLPLWLSPCIPGLYAHQPASKQGPWGSPVLSQVGLLRPLSRTLSRHSLWYFLVWTGRLFCTGRPFPGLAWRPLNQPASPVRKASVQGKYEELSHLTLTVSTHSSPSSTCPLPSAPCFCSRRLPSSAVQLSLFCLPQHTQVTGVSRFCSSRYAFEYTVPRRATPPSRLLRQALWPGTASITSSWQPPATRSWPGPWTLCSCCARPPGAVPAQSLNQGGWPWGR